MVFPVVMLWTWELDYKESWVLKNWCFWTVVLENILESPLDCKEIQAVHPKGNQSWLFIGGTDAEAETPYFGHLMWRSDSFEKTLLLGKIEGRRRRGWQRMRLLDGITDSMDMILSKLWELGDGQGSLVCCSPWGCKESDTTEWLNSTENDIKIYQHRSSIIFSLGHTNHWSFTALGNLQCGYFSHIFHVTVDETEIFYW